MDKYKGVAAVSIGGIVLALGALLTFNSQVDKWLKTEIQPYEDRMNAVALTINQRLNAIEATMKSHDDEVDEIREDMNNRFNKASDRRNVIGEDVNRRFDSLRLEESIVVKDIATIKESISWLKDR